VNKAVQLPMIVYEQTGRWTAALRSLELSRTVRLFEFRTLTHVEEQLATTPAAIVCLEMTTANVLDVYRWLWTAGQDCPHARYVVLDNLNRDGHVKCPTGDRPCYASMLGLVREAGVIHSLTSTRDIDQLLPIVGRYLSNPGFVTLNGSVDSGSHSRQSTVVERLLANLPLRNVNHRGAETGRIRQLAVKKRAAFDLD